MTDNEREQLIEAWRQVVELDPDRDAKSVASMRMRSLILQRSSEHVAQMELERGLRAS
jgi:hypothetical protein